MVDQNWSIPSFEESNQPAFELIDEGMYKVQLGEIGELQPSPFDPTGKKQQAQFTFYVVEDPDWEGYRINAWYTISMNERSNLYPVVKALMGGEIDPKQPIVPGQLLGRRMMANVVHGTPNDQGNVWPKIKGASPVRKPRNRQQPSIVEAAQEQFDAEPDLSDAPF